MSGVKGVNVCARDIAIHGKVNRLHFNAKRLGWNPAPFTHTDADRCSKDAMVLLFNCAGQQRRHECRDLRETLPPTWHLFCLLPVLRLVLPVLRPPDRRGPMKSISLSTVNALIRAGITTVSLQISQHRPRSTGSALWPFAHPMLVGMSLLQMQQIIVFSSLR